MRWRCVWCGREYDTETATCETCGHERFEPVENDTDTAAPFESGAVAWVCTDCGREHVKRSPPCSRCGGHSLERRAVDSAEQFGDISTPGYLSVGKPYLLGIVAVIVLVSLVLAGVIPLPGFSGPPTPPAAPGDADRSSGVELAVVEAELYDRFEAERTATGATDRGRDPGLDAFAEYATRHSVAGRYDPAYDGTVPNFGEFDAQCRSSPTLTVVRRSLSIGEYGNEAEFSTALADRLLASPDVREMVLRDGAFEGIDIHIGPDGTVFVGYIVC